MLTRLFMIATLALGAVLAPASVTATAAGGVACPPIVTICTVEVAAPGTPGNASAERPVTTVGDGQCRTGSSDVVPCWNDEWGWFNASDSCYYKFRDPQPPGTDPVWEGNFPNGAVYVVSCADPLGAPGSNGGWTWLPGPPAGYGGDPAQLAERAVERMALEGPAIRTPLDGEEIGTVGIPLWLWTEQGATTWGPTTATASVPGLSVTATAAARWIDWDLGDGSTMRCEGPGTPFIPGRVESPTCDHIYTVSSAGQPGDVFTVTGTTTWEVTWSGGAMSGVLQVTRSSSTTVPIGELQVLATQ